MEKKTMKKEALTRPFRPDQIRQRVGQRGRTVCYVDINTII